MGGLTARDPGFIAALRAAVRGTVRENEGLGRYSTYRIGGPATILLPSTAEDVSVALRMVAAAGIPWFVVGLGSNLLFPDAGLEALVIRLGKGIDRIESSRETWRLGAGLPAPRRAANGGGGLGGVAPLRGRAGHRWWRDLHECRLPRRGVGRGGDSRPGH